MGLFGCDHRYKNYGRKNKGIQQQKCSKCGRLRNKKVSTFFCSHKWKQDRRRKKTVLVCKKCGKEREVSTEENG